MRALLISLCLALSVSRIARADEASLDEARTLDQQGVRAYKDGRYKDAIVYFEHALKLGGPSSELWNVAKCHLKLDEPEAAHEAFDEYLSREDLSTDDRSEALAQREALDRRTSPLTVTSNPTGARVVVDGKSEGAAPITINVGTGSHEVRVEQDGYAPFVSTPSARYGRAIVLTADLTKGPDSSDSATPTHRGRISIEAGVGLTATRYDTVGGSPMPMGFLLGTYSLLDSEHWILGAGLRLGVNGDAWGTTAGVANIARSPSCKVPADYSSVSVLAHAVGVASYRITPRVRTGLDAGFGLITSSASDLGGDVFNPQCGASPGVQPAGHFALEASYQILPFLRVVARPLILDVQPAYDGTRNSASGVWLRFSFSLGAALDF